MKYTKLGNSGTVVSSIALGTWHLPGKGNYNENNVENGDEEEFNRIFKKCYDLGINFYDTSNIYHGRVEENERHIPETGNSERVLGRAIKGIERESLVIATKVRGPMDTFPNSEGLSRKHIMWQIRESLKRLDIDYVDLYQAHWMDKNTPVKETVRTLSHLIDIDLVRYIGESNHDAIDIEKFMHDSEIYNLHDIVTLQEPYNILQRDIEKDKLKIAKKYNLGILAYVPLAQGLLSGKYLKSNNGRSEYVPELLNMNDEYRNKIEKLLEFSKEKEISGTQLALAWLLKRSEMEKIPIIPLLGITKFSYVEENLDALNINLNMEDMKYLDEITLM